MKLGRCLVIAGGAILLIGGLLRAYDYQSIEPTFEAALLTAPHFLGVFKAMWWAFAVEFVVLGLIVLWAVRVPAGRGTILLCGLIPAITSFLMFHYIGVFFGDIAYALAAVLLLVGGWMLPRSRESHPASRMW